MRVPRPFFIIALCLPLVSTGPATFAQPSTPAARPFNQSLDPKWSDLLARLASEDFKSRDAAQKDLAKVGHDNRNVLESLLNSTRDPEVQSRLQSQIDALDSNPPPISIDLKAADARQTLAALCKATQTRIALLINDADPHRYTLQARDHPYWEIVTALAAQGDWQLGARNKWLTITSNKTANPHFQISGPFLIFYDLTADRRLNLSVFADPRLHIVQNLPPEFTAILDEQGNSLIPEPDPDRLAMRPAPLPGPPEFRDTTTCVWHLNVPLKPLAFQKIASLNAAIRCRLDIVDRLDIPDVEHAIGKSFTAGPATITLQHYDLSHTGALNFAFQAKFPSDQRIYLTLLDGQTPASGNFLLTMGSTGLIPRNFTGPATLRLEWPRQTRTLSLRFELKDLVVREERADVVE